MVKTARCYSCHVLRPLSDFPYRRKDSAISASSRLRRYVSVLLQRPGASRSHRHGSGGAVYRYRCVHPRAGQCPGTTLTEAPESVALGSDACVQDDHPPRLDWRQNSDFVGHEVEVVVEVEVEFAAHVERTDFRKEKEEACDKLQQCVGAMERSVATS
jgi:hypothetical protein